MKRENSTSFRPCDAKTADNIDTSIHFSEMY